MSPIIRSIYILICKRKVNPDYLYIWNGRILATKDPMGIKLKDRLKELNGTNRQRYTISIK
jgi:hypothetical protein